MLKVIVCPRRHPSMTRQEFFVYLKEKHAPLVLGHDVLMSYLRRYIQNHTRISEDAWAPQLDYRWNQDRDSVIEIWYDSLEALTQATHEPAYLADVRPDEHRFNDLSTVLILCTQEEKVFAGTGAQGPAKVFDFVTRSSGISAGEFAERWREYGAALAQDSDYRKRVSSRIHNLSVAGDDSAFGEAALFDGVAESWLDPAVDAQHADLRTPLPADFIDVDKSFSVIALERPIYTP